ncbi:hypothetical protein [Arthrobacter pityocampae]|uniref:hypothetical protein n=1 Tax=Arthrobacter pityocampae TaxID=547334 RepID=UPI003734F008
MSTPAILEGKPWQQQGLALIAQLADEGKPFDAYSLSQRGLEKPAHPNHWGALFRVAHSHGLIEVCAIHTSARPERAKGLCRVWIGATA